MLLWSVKGGSGTSVVAASLSIINSRHRPTLLVDLAGDQPAILGSARPHLGLDDWLVRRSPGEFDDLLVAANDNLQIAWRTSDSDFRHETAAWTRLARLLEQRHTDGTDIVVDAGLAPVAAPLLEACSTHHLVIRPCYLALRRAVDLTSKPDSVIVVDERDRALRPRDVESVLKTQVAAEVPHTVDIARRVDSGLLNSRLPHNLFAALVPLTNHPTVAPT